MNHSQWKTRRTKQLHGEAVEENPEYERMYEEAGLARASWDSSSTTGARLSVSPKVS